MQETAEPRVVAGVIIYFIFAVLVTWLIFRKKRLDLYTRRPKCPNCSTVVERLANYCRACGTKMPSLKPLTAEERERTEREFFNRVESGKCSKEKYHHKETKNAAGPMSAKDLGYCSECGEERYEFRT